MTTTSMINRQWRLGNINIDNNDQESNERNLGDDRKEQRQQKWFPRQLNIEKYSFDDNLREENKKFALTVERK